MPEDSIIVRLADFLPQIPDFDDRGNPVSSQDEPDDEAVEDIGHAEGQSFIIEYRDSKGRITSRRITVFAIVRGASGIPCLMARCHEAQATRQFRVDRIRYCADFSGEIFDDVPAFLAETFGMPEGEARHSGPESQTGRWKRILELIRPRAVPLAAVSRSDGVIRSVELVAAAQYLGNYVEHNSDIFLEEQEVERIITYLRRLRPTADALLRSLSYLRRCEQNDQAAYFRAMIDVMQSDGQEHPSEIAIINDTAIEIIGFGIL